MKMLFLMGSVLSAAALSSCVEFSDEYGADTSASFGSWRSDCYSDSRRPAPSYAATPSSAPNCDPRGDATQRTHHWRGHQGSPAAGHAADHPHHASDQPRSGRGGWFGGHRGNDPTSNPDGAAQQHHQRPQRENQASASSGSTPTPPTDRERRQEERPSERQPDPISTSLPSPQPDPAPAASAPEPAPSEPAAAPAAPEPAPAPAAPAPSA
ncbi:MAG: hypothetical protein B7Z37_25755 [Verrucomicrobia bacterium 12-59-8]|nr:MAG: hypothetical protein B7Z37_25755 [Verrucomicrobia bacterium 12-59-8]